MVDGPAFGEGPVRRGEVLAGNSVDAPIAEIVNQQGPKYQYGTGCLSDGVLGLWMARVCGLDVDLIDVDRVASHLTAIHRYKTTLVGKA